MSIESQCVEHGICKIVPPPGWKPRVLPARRADKDNMQLNGLVRQEAIGHGGTFQCMNATQKPMTIGEFKKLALKDENLLAWTPEQHAKADFWDLEKKSISPKPPVYGADNFSASFFEESMRTARARGQCPTVLHSGGFAPCAHWDYAPPSAHGRRSMCVPCTDDCSSRTAAQNKDVNEARRMHALYPFLSSVNTEILKFRL